jgi:hypothetical protein
LIGWLIGQSHERAARDAAPVGRLNYQFGQRSKPFAKQRSKHCPNRTHSDGQLNRPIPPKFWVAHIVLPDISQTTGFKVNTSILLGTQKPHRLDQWRLARGRELS